MLLLPALPTAARCVRLLLVMPPTEALWLSQTLAPPIPPRHAQLELDARLQRQEGGGLQLAFSRIDGVLRLRERD